MKRTLLFCILALGLSFAFPAYSQGKEATWNYSAKKIADKTYEIHFTVAIQSPWHIYSQNMGSGGPVPTSFSFNKNPLVIVNGKPKELGSPVEKYEEVFDMKVKYYESKVDFVQLVKLKNNIKTNVSGKIQYMLCTNEQCLPPQSTNFTINLQ